MRFVLFCAKNKRVLGVLMMAAAMVACTSTPEEKSAKFMAEGKRLLLQKDAARAILQFRNALEATPNDPDVLYQLALAYLETRDVGTAAKALRKATEIDPKHSGATLKLAELMANADDRSLWEEAQVLLSSLLDESPDDPDALHALALTELKLGQGGATDHLQRALASAPKELRIAVTLAQAKLQQKDPKGAENVLTAFVQGSPQSSQAQVILSYFYISQKRIAEGEAHLRKAVELDAKNGEALLILAKIEFSDGRQKEAEEHLKQLVDVRGYEPMYGVFLSQQGRHDEALKQFEGFAKRFPDNRQARTNLLAALQRANRTDETKKLLDQALRNNSRDMDALLQRAELFINERDFVKAGADLAQVLKLKADAPEAHFVLARLNQARGNMQIYREELAKALQLNPYLIQVRVESAQELILSNNGKAAIDVLNQAPASQTGALELLVQRNWANYLLGNLAEMRQGIDFGLAQGKSVDFLVQDGLWKLRSRQVAAARQTLEEALRLNPLDLRAIGGIQATYIESGQAALGLQKLKEHAAAHPNSAPVQSHLGATLLTDNDLKGARKAFQLALAADPGFIKAEQGLAQIDLLEGNQDAARQRVDALIAAGRADPTTEFWKANLEQMKGNYKGAIDQFRKVVEAQPENADALNNLAFLLAEHAQSTDEALKYAQKAVSLDPQNAAFADTLGWILYRKELYGAAIQHLERAGASRGDVVWKYHLAMAYAKSGNFRKGQSTLSEALKIDPSVPEAKEAQELVRSSQ